MRNSAITLMFVVGVMLTACISGRPPKDTVTDPSGKVIVIESDREQCERSCNDDYSRCMETTDARDNGGVLGAPAGMFGEGADCRSNLSSCLPTCKSR